MLKMRQLMICWIMLLADVNPTCSSDNSGAYVILYYFPHEFAGMAEKTRSSIALALFVVFFFERV